MVGIAYMAPRTSWLGSTIEGVQLGIRRGMVWALRTDYYETAF